LRCAQCNALYENFVVFFALADVVCAAAFFLGVVMLSLKFAAVVRSRRTVGPSVRQDLESLGELIGRLP
jgi:hypothetical protein